MDEGRAVDVISLDFSKAFNMISDHVIVSKLGSYGQTPNTALIFQLCASEWKPKYNQTGYWMKVDTGWSAFLSRWREIQKDYNLSDKQINWKNLLSVLVTEYALLGSVKFRRRFLMLFF